MIAILAVNNLGFIGKDNKIMWRCSEDLNFFKQMTMNKVMLVGYNTYQTLPGVVKKREIVLDGRGEPFQKTERLNSTFVPSTDPNPVYSAKQVICIGGKKTYEKYCHLFTELHISHINDNQIGDCTMPDLRNLPDTCKVFNYNFEVNK